MLVIRIIIYLIKPYFQIFLYIVGTRRANREKLIKINKFLIIFNNDIRFKNIQLAEKGSRQQNQYDYDYISLLK